MTPRVQTFAWRLLRKAFPIGKRAGRYSKHIIEKCSRCGQLEDEMHMLFLCPFSKVAWFCYPWFIKTESLAENYHSIPDMIRALITSQHPQINLTTLYFSMVSLESSERLSILQQIMQAFPGVCFSKCNN